MDETVFLEQGNIKVTNARFIVKDQTYAMASVNSVKVTKTDITPSNLFPIILIIISVVWLMNSIASPNGLASFFWPLGLLGFSILWLRSIKQAYEYRIMLTTSSGETPALKSTNDQDIRPVEKALNEAIVFRG